MTGQHVQGEEQKESWLIVALIVAVAFFLRFAALGKLELWLDENYSVLMATAPEGVLRSVMNDTNPPLYLYLLKGWIALFGISAAAVRSLSAVLGVAQLVALGLWLKRMGLGRRAALWAVALGALGPLHVYYSQEARSYTLTWLLATLALWSFSEAAARGTWRRWMLHGASIVVGLYTHNLFMFLVPGIWASALLMQFGRREWLRMTAVYLGVGLFYFPWFYLTVHAVQQGGVAWIVESWPRDQAVWMIPSSLETVAMGSQAPRILRMGTLAPGTRIAAMAWLIMVLAFGFGKYAGCGKMGRGEAQANLEPAGVSWARMLTVLTLVPLLAMLIYSFVAHPIYIVGRYDTLVYPALLGLLGIGAGNMQAWLERRARPWLAVLIVLCVPLTVTGSLAWQKLKPFPQNELHLHQIQAARAEVLKEFSRPGDLVVCLGLEGGKIAYQMKLRGIKLEMMTFPLETQRHLGFFHTREVAGQMEMLKKDAATILNRLVAGAPGRRLWLMLDPFSFRKAAPGSMEEAYTRITMVLLDAFKSRGVQQWMPPELVQRTNMLGIRVYLGSPDQ